MAYPIAEGLDTPVEVLTISVRLLNGLRNAGCKTLGDVLKLSEWQLSRIYNIGKKSIEELHNTLQQEKQHESVGRRQHDAAGNISVAG